MNNFEKIVKILLKKQGSILFKDDIFEIIDPEKKQKYKSILDKTIYLLKIKGIILNIKSGVYIVPSLEDKNLNKIDLIEKYYLKMLKKYINLFTSSDYFISGKKSLEVHLKNYSIPEKIFITTRKLNKKIFIGTYEIIFKTISGKKDGKKINLFQKMYNFSNTKKIEQIEFRFSCLELALLESSVIFENKEFIDLTLIQKVLKKYKNNFDINIFYEISNYKYIMSFNRLKELSKSIDMSLYMIFLDIVKKKGALFIGEGLRGF